MTRSLVVESTTKDYVYFDIYYWLFTSFRVLVIVKRQFRVTCFVIVGFQSDWLSNMWLITTTKIVEYADFLLTFYNQYWYIFFRSTRKYLLHIRPRRTRKQVSGWKAWYCTIYWNELIQTYVHVDIGLLRIFDFFWTFVFMQLVKIVIRRWAKKQDMFSVHLSLSLSFL